MIDKLAEVVTPALLLAAVAWLAKVLILDGLRRESDRLRSSLEKDAALGIEKVRQSAAAELEAARHAYSRDLEEHKVRFSRLQDLRVEPICRLYASLATMCSKAGTVHVFLTIDMERDIGSDIEGLRECMVDAAKALDAALLYLPPDVIGLVDDLVSKVRDAEFAYYMQGRRAPGDIESAQRALMNVLPLDLSAPLRVVADKIRFLLGVEAAKPATRA